MARRFLNLFILLFSISLASCQVSYDVDRVKLREVIVIDDDEYETYEEDLTEDTDTVTEVTEDVAEDILDVPDVEVVIPPPVCDNCGNLKCDTGETIGTCPADCPYQAGCPDGYCDAPSGENASCREDCAFLRVSGSQYCGDNKCEGEENSRNCTDCIIQGCGVDSDVDGNPCDYPESPYTCPADCSQNCL